jgi:hypothetical protein
MKQRYTYTTETGKNVDRNLERQPEPQVPHLKSVFYQEPLQQITPQGGS